jgi:hypothetical protein
MNYHFQGDPPYMATIREHQEALMQGKKIVEAPSSFQATPTFAIPERLSSAQIIYTPFANQFEGSPFLFTNEFLC